MAQFLVYRFETEFYDSQGNYVDSLVIDNFLQCEITWLNNLFSFDFESLGGELTSRIPSFPDYTYIKLIVTVYYSTSPYWGNSYISMVNNTGTYTLAVRTAITSYGLADAIRTDYYPNGVVTNGSYTRGIYTYRDGTTCPASCVTFESDLVRVNHLPVVDIYPTQRFSFEFTINDGTVKLEPYVSDPRIRTIEQLSNDDMRAVIYQRRGPGGFIFRQYITKGMGLWYPS